MTTIPTIPKELETERLVLRMPKPGDGAVVNAAIRASINELKSWMPFAQTVPTVEETEINTVEAHLNFLKKTVLRYLIFDKETGQFIGSTGFHNIDWEVPKLEIGYWLDTRASGRGYVTEAVQRLTQLALDGFCCKRVEIQCEVENTASRKVAEKAGFQLEGILRNDELSADGERITDTCIYAVVADRNSY
ncbi:GNAT family N-acetyltransferase [Planococcus lenghuensis]|uniref:GNAT family N-acetyltransferase n=1 Tax=Planococcus lenghuensis TaxID=2213202 RepID=A0A1Q2KUG9_9BACL|nr:GNAT family protein [Planococcus lenghuensis]AQQ51858.1 GNAT family N-acetyltransferase [Planococcus lenghuensis]